MNQVIKEDIMDEEQLLKKLRMYKGIILVLITMLFGAIGYSYSLRLDINALQDKVDYHYDLIINSYIRNIHKSLNERVDQ